MATYSARVALPEPSQCAKLVRGPSSLRRVVHVVRGRPGPDDRPALPSGHPDTWGLITAGTCIEGAPYPFPVFVR
jgi:hypothetical protein